MKCSSCGKELNTGNVMYCCRFETVQTPDVLSEEDIGAGSGWFCADCNPYNKMGNCASCEISAIGGCLGPVSRLFKQDKEMKKQKIEYTKDFNDYWNQYGELHASFVMAI